MVTQGDGTPMSRRYRLARGVLWYPVSKTFWAVASPLVQGQEKCRLLHRSHAVLLDFFRRNSFLSEDSIPSQMKETAERWLSPRFAMLEEIKEQRRLEDYEHLAAGIFQEYRSAKEPGACHDLASYYRHDVQDPLRQFEEVETTVSHLYREGHPALQGKSYGARFAEILLEEGALREAASILEVGCGTGLFGSAFLSAVKRSDPGLYRRLRYTYLDLSPVLSDSQRRTNNEHKGTVSFVQGNAVAGDMEENAYDVIISNEVIADLPVIGLDREKRRRKGLEGEAWQLARKLGLSFTDAPPRFLLNIGALRFLSNLSRALRAGGKAYVVEYGSPFSYPVSQFVTDHTENSIHFGHLLHGARALGLKGSLRVLTEFLRFDPDTEVLDSLSHAALFDHLLPFLGIDVESRRIYTRSMLTQSLPGVARKVRNLGFVPLSSLKGIAYPDGFYVLRMTKEGPSGWR